MMFDVLLIKSISVFQILASRTELLLFFIVLLAVFIIIYQQYSRQHYVRRLTKQYNKNREAYEVLNASELKYHSLFESASDAIFIMQNYQCLDLNSKCAELFGFHKDELLNFQIADISPEKQPNGFDSKEKAQYFIDNALKGEPQFFEWTHKKADGSLFEAEVSIKPFWVKDQAYLTVLLRDLTAKRKMELDAIKNEALFKTIGENLPYEFWVCDTNNYYTYLNPKAIEKWGNNVGLSIYEVAVDAETLRRWESNNNRALRGEVVKLEGEYVYKGNLVNLYTILSPVVVRDVIVGLMGINIDITDIKKAEEQSRESEKRFRNIFNSSKDAILIIGFDRRILDANRAFFTETGYEVADLDHITVYDLVLPKYIKELEERMAKIYHGEIMPVFEMEIMKKTDGKVPVEVNSYKIDYGGVTAILSMARDISERKNMEKRIFELSILTEERERQKLAANLHDDVGPLLSSMNMYLSTLVRKPEIQKYRDNIDTISNILQETITSVRAISNNISPHILTNYGLVPALKWFLGSQEKLIKVEFAHSLENKRLAENFEISLYRVIKELVNNTLKYAKASKIYVDILQNKDQLHITYRDDGIGFDYEIFSNSQNRGMGLKSISNRIHSLGGSYRIRTKDNEGFLFESTINIV